VLLNSLIHFSTSQRFGTAAAGIPFNKVIRAQRHTFHILPPSPLPFYMAVFLLSFIAPLIYYFHDIDWSCTIPRPDMLHFGFLGVYFTVINWFIAIIWESELGYHTKRVQYGLRLGMALFILSEVMFFFAFFWSFFHFSLNPSIAIGAVWPPVGTQPLSIWRLPFVNTLLLLTSGITVTAAHQYILRGDAYAKDAFSFFLMLTVFLGAAFLFCQFYEYKYVIKFSWRENIYGSIFFVTTGFHGLHVTIGTLFLNFCWARHFFTSLHSFGQTGTTLLPLRAQASLRLWARALPAYLGKGCGFKAAHHFGFEAAAWYWHFVDVVWLFLFIAVYCWGGA
jgi:cytochrome c oxidase subunit 3